ncbi:MAG: hypothetical protein IJX81_07490 [Clostridia bacterium]|nr:hypothetical protein [Clostridia bacterium]
MVCAFCIAWDLWRVPYFTIGGVFFLSLVSRLIDRPIRPLFPKGIFNDVVVVATARK